MPGKETYYYEVTSKDSSTVKHVIDKIINVFDIKNIDAWRDKMFSSYSDATYLVLRYQNNRYNLYWTNSTLIYLTKIYKKESFTRLKLNNKVKLHKLNTN